MAVIEPFLENRLRKSVSDFHENGNSELLRKFFGNTPIPAEDCVGQAYTQPRF